MTNKYLDGIKFGLGFITIIGLIFSVFAIGFHQASEILPGTFQTGDYSFDGFLNIFGEEDNGRGLYIKDPNSLIAYLGDGSTTQENGLLNLYNNDESISIHLLAANGYDNYINNGGNFGIGTTNPQTTLSINGSISYPIYEETTQTGNIDVTDKTIIQLNTAGGNIDIQGFTGGVKGQVIYLFKASSANSVILRFSHASGIQKIITQTWPNDMTLGNNVYSGFKLIFTGTNWFVLD